MVVVDVVDVVVVVDVDVVVVEGVVVVEDIVDVVVELGCSTEITTVVPRFTWVPAARDWLVT